MSILNNDYPTTSTDFIDNIRQQPSNPTKAQSLYDKIDTSKRTQGGMRFPSDLGREGSDSVIRFNVNLPSGSKYFGGAGGNPVSDTDGNPMGSTRARESSSGVAGRMGGNTIRTDTVVDLFLPPNIETTYSSTWNTEGTGVVGATTDAIMGLSEAASNNGVDGVLGVSRNALNGMQSFGIRALSNMTDSVTGMNTQGATQAATGTIRNPYMEVIFEGINPRTFSFTFKMIPRNAGEQATIREIVKTFKFHQAPEIKDEGSSAHWLFPSEFDISFLHNGSENPWIHKISTCALTSVNVSYSAEGQYATHNDGSPFSTTLTLEFQEMILLTKEKIEEGY